MVISIPVHMDDGRTLAFTGYRVQHSLTSGPSKGGLRYHPTVDLGEVAALAMWMSWKCGLMNLPFGGGKGGVACDPAAFSPGELERLTRRLTEELLPVIGPRMDVMAPDLGTDEQTMAWIMDTYSMKIGYACPEIVTGKPVELGGCVGRREATGRGVVFVVSEALKELDLRPEQCTAVVQGFGNVGSVVCQELSARGVKILAVGDRYGSIRNSKGIDINRLNQHLARGKLLREFPDAEVIPDGELLTQPCTRTPHRSTAECSPRPPTDRPRLKPTRSWTAIPIFS
jgi:glutamate dehydrogenase (NAD(P)+)